MTIITPPYCYDLGWYIRDKRFCRIPKDKVPVGTVKIIKYRRRKGDMWISPYYDTGELRQQYWSLRRHWEFE